MLQLHFLPQWYFFLCRDGSIPMTYIIGVYSLASCLKDTSWSGRYFVIQLIPVCIVSTSSHPCSCSNGGKFVRERKCSSNAAGSPICAYRFVYYINFWSLSNTSKISQNWRQNWFSRSGIRLGFLAALRKAVEIMDAIDFEGAVEFEKEELTCILDSFATVDLLLQNI